MVEMVQDKSLFRYFDLWSGVSAKEIDLLFPQWQAKDERLLVISPHDDDGVIGAGYLILAAQANGAEVYVLVVCNGCFGYSRVEDRETIVERRRAETIRAYRRLGIPEDRILRLDYPDFSAWAQLGWRHPGGFTGSTSHLMPLLRSVAPTRIVLPNGFREHQDHEAAYRMAAYDGPQTGDAVLAEFGLAAPVRSYLQYSVWADFDPIEALSSGLESGLRANRAIQADKVIEEKIAASILEFESQEQVIRDLTKRREASRIQNEKGIELYLTIDPRPVLDFGPYHRRIQEIYSKEMPKVKG